MLALSRKQPRHMFWAFPLAISVLFLNACASYTEQTKEITSDYRADKFASALKKIQDSDLKDQSRNRLLYLLEKGMILTVFTLYENAILLMINGFLILQLYSAAKLLIPP